jgi:hypothetical protein
VFCNVPTRLVVEAPPAFFRQKLTVTVSSGSTAPFGGAQLSVFSVEPAATIMGMPCKHTGMFVVAPVEMLKLPETVANVAFDTENVCGPGKSVASNVPSASVAP